MYIRTSGSNSAGKGGQLLYVQRENDGFSVCCAESRLNCPHALDVFGNRHPRTLGTGLGAKPLWLPFTCVNILGLDWKPHRHFVCVESHVYVAAIAMYVLRYRVVLSQPYSAIPLAILLILRVCGSKISLYLIYNSPFLIIYWFVLLSLYFSESHCYMSAACYFSADYRFLTVQLCSCPLCISSW